MGGLATVISAAGRARAEQIDRALAEVDGARVAALCAELVDLASPTGDERPLAEWLAERLSPTLDAHVQPLDHRQANAWARRRGTGQGPSLLLYSPIDTLTVGCETEDLPMAGPTLSPDMRPVASTVDRAGARPLVQGLGAMNPKGHAACVAAAALAIAEAGVELDGDLLVGFGAGGMPTNARPGDRFHTGQGVGASFLVEQGVVADAAVIAKSGWAVAWEEVGLAWIDVTVRGIHTYVGARHRLPYRNPIADAARVVSHLESWFPVYAATHRTELCEPQGIVAAIEAGWWRMAAVTPASARLRVDLRLAPGQSSLDAKRELDASLAELTALDPGLSLETELAVSIPGSRTDPAHWIVSTAIRAWEQETGRPHQPITGTSGATDANILRSRGIPTVRVGLPKVHRSVNGEPQEVGFAEGMNTVSVEALETLTRYLVRVAIDATSELNPPEDPS